jgi:DNA replication initiation complex subunit (GINS family)
MVDIRINYETLFDLLRREKNREELQALDKDFYEQVFAYLNEKKSSLNKKEDELFASAEKEKLKIQFQNIRRLIKELYEKREKKIINMAMGKARTGSDVIDTSALLPSEKEFFNDQVSLFVQYKDKVLDRILNLKEFDNSKAEQDKKEGSPLGQEIVKPKEETKEEIKKEVKEEKEEKEISVAAGAVERKKVLITDSLPRFVGRDGEILGPFNEGEEVELDSQIADVLVKKGKAEATE